MRKVFSILLVVCLTLTAMVIPAMADEPIKLTVAIPDKVNVEDYNTNELTLQIEQELGVDLDF